MKVCLGGTLHCVRRCTLGSARTRRALLASTTDTCTPSQRTGRWWSTCSRATARAWLRATAPAQLRTGRTRRSTELRRGALAGILATVGMDVGARRVVAPALRLEPPGVENLGRWVAHMREGQFVHDDICAARSARSRNRCCRPLPDRGHARGGLFPPIASPPQLAAARHRLRPCDDRLPMVHRLPRLRPGGSDAGRAHGSPRSASSTTSCSGLDSALRALGLPSTPTARTRSGSRLRPP